MLQSNPTPVAEVLGGAPESTPDFRSRRRPSCEETENPRERPASAKPAYVVSDAHLGPTSGERARDLVRWLRIVRERASHLVLNGDIFDFWFEYRRVIPRGHVRVLGAIAEVADAGVPVTFMGGNHDWWGGSCLRDEVGVAFRRRPVRIRLSGRAAYVAHGDGLGDGDRAHRILSRILRARSFLRVFRTLHPDLGAMLASLLSKANGRSAASPAAGGGRVAPLEAFALRKLEQEQELDLVVLGHTHVPAVVEAKGRYYVNAGSWMRDRCYAVIDSAGPPRIEHWRREGRQPGASIR